MMQRQKLELREEEIDYSEFLLLRRCDED